MGYFRVQKQNDFNSHGSILEKITVEISVSLMMHFVCGKKSAYFVYSVNVLMLFTYL